MIQFEDNEFLTEEVIDCCLALYIHVKIYGKLAKEALADTRLALNICSFKFLKNFEEKFLSKFKRSIVRFYNMEKQYVIYIYLLVLVRPKIIKIKTYEMDKKLLYNILIRRPLIHTMGVVSSTLYK